MGKNRDRKDKRHANKTSVIGTISRKVVAIASRRAVLEELRRGDVAAQVARLDDLTTHRALPHSKLRDAIVRSAPKEMDKGISKLQHNRVPVTVDNLCAEVKSTPGFLEMCAKAGLDLSWFENLARERMEAKGIR